MRGVDPADPATDEQRFGDWLAAHGQSDRARRALWDLFTVSALNMAGDDASLSLAATVVQTGLLGRSNAADIGVPARPLGELHGDAAAALLAKLGAQVVLGAKVSAIEAAARLPAAGPAYRVRLARPLDPAGPTGPADPADSRGSRERALRRDRVPGGRGGAGCAARGRGPPGPARRAAGLHRGGLGGPERLAHRQRARDLRPPGHGPALRRRRRLPGPVGLRPHRHLRPRPPRGPRQPRPRPRQPPPAPPPRRRRPQYLAISLSAADEYVDVPAATLRERFLPALAELFPAAREARVAEFFVTRERRATFRQVPGTGKLRPRAGTQLPGLVLAGAWTDTGWPDTMESAVRSGLAAAIELRRTVLSVPGLSRSGLSHPGLSRLGLSRSGLSRSGLSRIGLSRTGLSRTGNSRSGSSDSVLSGSEVNASTSTMGVRQ